MLLKFGILILILAFRDNEYLVQYTYFLSVSAVLSCFTDWGGSRQNVRYYIELSILPLNLISIIVAIVGFLIIYCTELIKFDSVIFLLISFTYAIIIGWSNTLRKYYEYTSNNKILYEVQIVINIFLFVCLSLLIVFNQPVESLYISLLFGNIFLLLYLLMRYGENIKFVLDFSLVHNGFPFLVNSLSALAFSQINILVLNQFATTYQISNYTISQRLIDVSLIISNSYNSSSIGKFFKKETDLITIRNNSFKIWVITFILCIPVAYTISELFQGYEIVIFLFLVLFPLGLSRSISPTFSIVLDYTEHYLLRTYGLLIILTVNITCSRYVLDLSGGIYSFCIFINILMILLLAFYFYTFKKYNISETFHN